MEKIYCREKINRLDTYLSNQRSQRQLKKEQANPITDSYMIFLKLQLLYLLDKDKRIIAKQLSLEQFDDLIETKSKTLR